MKKKNILFSFNKNLDLNILLFVFSFPTPLDHDFKKRKEINTTIIKILLYNYYTTKPL